MWFEKTNSRYALIVVGLIAFLLCLRFNPAGSISSESIEGVAWGFLWLLAPMPIMIGMFANDCLKGNGNRGPLWFGMVVCTALISLHLIGAGSSIVLYMILGIISLAAIRAAFTIFRVTP